MSVPNINTCKGYIYTQNSISKYELQTIIIRLGEGGSTQYDIMHPEEIHFLIGRGAMTSRHSSIYREHSGNFSFWIPFHFPPNILPARAIVKESKYAHYAQRERESTWRERREEGGGEREKWCRPGKLSEGEGGEKQWGGGLGRYICYDLGGRE